MNHSPITKREEYFTQAQKVMLGLPSREEIVILVRQRRESELRGLDFGIVAGSHADDYLVENSYCICTWCLPEGSGWTGDCRIDPSPPPFHISQSIEPLEDEEYQECDQGIS